MEKNKIPKAAELIKLAETYDKDYPTISVNDAVEKMVEFAKLHVEDALSKAEECGDIRKLDYPYKGIE